MNGVTPEGTHGDRPPVEQERLPGPEPPRIYVASLSDYNAGSLHGEWIDATQEAETIWNEIQDMLARSPELIAEEYAIHDYEGFAGWSPDEYESIVSVAAVAQALSEHGPAVTAWISYTDESPESAIESFEEAYLGEWPSISNYVEHLVEDLGVTIAVEPEGWSRYVKFDTEALGRDLAIELSTAVSPDGGIYVFDSNALC